MCESTEEPNGAKSNLDEAEKSDSEKASLARDCFSPAVHAALLRIENKRKIAGSPSPQFAHQIMPQPLGESIPNKNRDSFFGLAAAIAIAVAVLITLNGIFNGPSTPYQQARASNSNFTQRLPSAKREIDACASKWTPDLKVPPSEFRATCKALIAPK